MRVNDVIQTEELPSWEGWSPPDAVRRAHSRREWLLSLFDEPSVRATKGDSVAEMVEGAEQAIEQDRRRLFKENRGNLPDILEETIALTMKGKRLKAELFAPDAITDACRAAKCSIPEIRRVADRLRFVVIPAEYVDQRVLDDAKLKRGTNPAKAFDRRMSGEFDVYVLGPMSIYDPARHVAAKTSRPLYFDPTNQAMGAVTMLIPTLRGMSKRLGSVEKRTEALEESVGEVRASMERLERQFGEEQLRHARENASLAERIQHLEAAAFRRRDPLMFAVPKGEDIETSGSFAILGPCWGEEFDEVVLEILGLSG